MRAAIFSRSTPCGAPSPLRCDPVRHAVARKELGVRRLRTVVWLANILVVTALNMAWPIARADTPTPARLVITLPTLLIKQAGARLTLGDVAQVSSNDLHLLQRALATPLTLVVTGADLRMNRREIENAVRSFCACAEVKLEWLGALDVEVMSGMQNPALRRDAPVTGPIQSRDVFHPQTLPARLQRIRGETLARLAVDGLRQNDTGKRRHSIVETTSIPEDLLLEPGHVTLSVQALPYRPGQRTNVWIDVRLNGKAVRRLAVGVTLEPALISDLDHSTVLPARPSTGLAEPSAADVPAGSAGYSYAPARALPAAIAVTTTSASASASAFSFTTTAANDADADADAENDANAVPISAPPANMAAHTVAAVIRGNQATLAFSKGAITLTSQVEVLQSGPVGELVRVKRPGSGKPLRALVQGPGQLMVAP